MVSKHGIKTWYQNYLLITMVLIVSMLLATNIVNAQVGTLGLCCKRTMDSVKITPTSDCCVNFKFVYYCGAYSDQPNFIQFERYNPSTGAYEVVTTEPVYDFYDTTNTKICPLAGETTLKYRIRLYDFDGVTPLECSYLPGFKEGYNQLTGEIALDCCPCPPERRYYLTVDVIPDACPDHGCLVKPHLNVPDSLQNCYKYFVYENDYEMTTYGPFELWDGRVTQRLDAYSFCLKVGESASITIYLLKYENEPLDKACKIVTRPIYCFEVPKPEKEFCKPDCYDDEWSAVETKKFMSTNCPGCIARVSYIHRFACPQQYQDLQITKIEFLTDQCDLCNIDMLYKDFLGSIIALNTMKFKPLWGEVGCNTTWRIANGGCWADWEYYVYDNGAIIDTVKIYEPCDSVECCLQPMKVCRDSNNAVTVTINTAYTGNSDCYGKWTISGTTGDTLYCYPACDWLAGLGGTYPYQEPHGFIKETYYPELDYQNSYGIHTKFNNELLTVYIKSNKQTNAKLSIIDLQGRELLLKNTDLYSGVNQLSISLNDLTSGIYIYTLEIDGIRIKTDKISIAK